MRHSTPLQLRFCDTDALGHVNNSAYAQYAELGRIDFFSASGTMVANLILARLELDFRQQLQPDVKATVETWVEKIGNTSITLCQSVMVEGKSACDMRSVIVFFDYHENKPTRVSDEVREKLKTFYPVE